MHYHVLCRHLTAFFRGKQELHQIFKFKIKLTLYFSSIPFLMIFTIIKIAVGLKSGAQACVLRVRNPSGHVLLHLNQSNFANMHYHVICRRLTAFFRGKQELHRISNSKLSLRFIFLPFLF